MLTELDFIIHEQEAMQSQIEFLEKCAIRWKLTSGQEVTDQKSLTQLILTTYYLREGFDEHYKHGDYYIQSRFGPLVTCEIKLKHQTITNAFDILCRSLTGLNDKVQEFDRDHISEIIDGLCRSLNMFCLEESKLFNPI